MSKSLGEIMSNDQMHKQQVIEDKHELEEIILNKAIHIDILKIFYIIKNKIDNSLISYESCRTGSVVLHLTTKIKYSDYIYKYKCKDELNILLSPNDLKIIEIEFKEISWGHEWTDTDPIPIVCCTSFFGACIPLIFYWIPMCIYRSNKTNNNYEITCKLDKI